MNDLDQYYRILELEPGASLEEIHQSYHDLALVWHPDRFLSHPRLLQKAHDKIKQINEARERLCQLVANVKVSAPKTSTTPQPKPTVAHSKPYYQPTREFYRSRVPQPNTAEYQRLLEVYIQTRQARQRDTCNWLD